MRPAALSPDTQTCGGNVAMEVSRAPPVPSEVMKLSDYTARNRWGAQDGIEIPGICPARPERNPALSCVSSKRFRGRDCCLVFFKNVLWLILGHPSGAQANSGSLYRLVPQGTWLCAQDCRYVMVNVYWYFGCLPRRWCARCHFSALPRISLAFPCSAHWIGDV